VQTFVVGLQGDIIAANRKLLEDIQYRVKRLDYEMTERSDGHTDIVKSENKTEIE
jgi:hypothetical protein